MIVLLKSAVGQVVRITRARFVHGWITTKVALPLAEAEFVVVVRDRVAAVAAKVVHRMLSFRAASQRLSGAHLTFVAVAFVIVIAPPRGTLQRTFVLDPELTAIAFGWPPRRLVIAPAEML